MNCVAHIFVNPAIRRVWDTVGVWAGRQLAPLVSLRTFSICPLLNVFRDAYLYILDHWRGRLTLAWAFWVNLVGVGSCIYVIQLFTRSHYADDPPGFFRATLIGFVVFRLVVFPWQAVGVLRASDRSLSEVHDAIWPRAAQGGVLLGILIVFLDALGIFHAFYDMRTWQEVAETAAQESRPGYELRVSADGETLFLEGFLEPGVTRAVLGALNDHPTVDTVVLESRGGRVYEARGVAKLVVERGLATQVFGECSSACTTAFIGGTLRIVGPTARIGFHRYRLEAWMVRPDVKPEHELFRDLAFYRSRGVHTDRLRRALETDFGDMWYPEHAELLEIGVVHMVQPDTIVP